MMFLIMTLDRSHALLMLMGGRSRRSGCGLSVPSARAAMVSMMRLTHRSWMALSGDPFWAMAPMKATSRAEKLTVSWNWRNLRMLSKMQRPHRTEKTMELKLSSRMIISEASFATSVPAIPIARPTSACLSAGASLVPSPVTPTTCLLAIRRCTRVSLSSGSERAKTWRRGRRASICSSVSLANSGPSMARPPGVRIPASSAIFLAVLMLSPVTMRTNRPAFWHFSTASGTSLRMGSRIPTIASTVRSVSGGSTSTAGLNSSMWRTHRHRVRRPLVASDSWYSRSCVRMPSVRGTSEPSPFITLMQSRSTISGAPLQYMRNPLAVGSTALIFLRAEENA
mmetsp:Transcript_25715/g.72046  ORF Transcript_25715/g.72046 Transcript_25715/m.72046 type:complete len:339 (+) Transcript_25715:611-1627(+)